MTPVPGALVVAWWNARVRSPVPLLDHAWPHETPMAAWFQALSDLERELGPALAEMVASRRPPARYFSGMDDGDHGGSAPEE